MTFAFVHVSHRQPVYKVNYKLIGAWLRYYADPKAEKSYSKNS